MLIPVLLVGDSLLLWFCVSLAIVIFQETQSSQMTQTEFTLADMVQALQWVQILKMAVLEIIFLTILFIQSGNSLHLSAMLFN